MKKGGNLAVCDYMDGNFGHVIVKSVRQKKTSIVWYHLYMEYKRTGKQTKTNQTNKKQRS